MPGSFFAQWRRLFGVGASFFRIQSRVSDGVSVYNIRLIDPSKIKTIFSCVVFTHCWVLKIYMLEQLQAV